MPDPGYKIPIDVEIATTGAAKGEAALDAQGEGAKRLEEALKRVNETTQRVEESIAETGNTAQAANPQLTQLVSLQRAQIASQLAASLGQAAAGIRQLAEDSKLGNKDMAEALMATSAAAESLATGLGMAAQGFAVGGPLGAAIGGTVGLLVGPLKSAFEDMNRSLALADASQKNAAISADMLTQARARLATEVLSEKLGDIYREELEFIQKQIQALESRGRIREAQRAADAATYGPGTGTGGVEDTMNSKLAAETAKVADAEEKLRLLQEAANRSADFASLAQEQYTEGQTTAARVKAAVAEAKTAALAAGAAETALAELKATSQATQQKIIAGSRDNLSSLAAETNAAITEQARAALAVMQAKAAEQGGQLGTLAAGAFSDIAKILSDKLPDAGQKDELVQALNKWASSSEGKDAAVFAGIQRMIDIVKKTGNEWKAIEGRISSLESQINSLRESRGR